MAEEDERQTLLAYMEARFGVPPTAFEGLLLFRRKNTWRMLRSSGHMGKAASLKPASVGIRAFHRIKGFIKPTTRLVQVVGAHATRSRLELSREDLGRLAGGAVLPCDAALSDGYVLLFHAGRPLGLGLLVGGRLRSQIPKSEARFFLDL